MGVFRSFWKFLGSLLTPKKTDSWKVIVLCLLVATTFWFFNALNKNNYTTRINYPFQISYNDSLYVPIKPLPKEIEIEVTGGGWDLLRKSFGFEMNPVVVPVSNPVETKYILGSSLNPDLTERLGETRLNFVFADTIMLNLERISKRKLKLVVDTLRLSLADNFKVKNPILIQPDSIEVTGPLSYVNALPDELMLDISQRNISENLITEVSVGSLGSNLYKLSPSAVSVSIELIEFAVFDQEVKLTLINFPDNPSIFPRRTFVKLKYKAPKDSFPSALIFPWEVGLDFNRLNKEDSTLRPFLIAYPGFAREIEIDPIEIEVIFERNE
jgi:hypothetical protein